MSKFSKEGSVTLGVCFLFVIFLLISTFTIDIFKIYYTKVEIDRRVQDINSAAVLLTAERSQYDEVEYIDINQLVLKQNVLALQAETKLENLILIGDTSVTFDRFEEYVLVTLQIYGYLAEGSFYFGKLPVASKSVIKVKLPIDDIDLEGLIIEVN